MFEAQCSHEEDAGPQQATRVDAREGGNYEAKHDCVVLEMTVVNQDRSRLHQDGDKSYGGRCCASALTSRIVAEKDDGCWNVDDVLRYNDCRTHEDLEELLFNPTGRIESKP